MSVPAVSLLSRAVSLRIGTNHTGVSSDLPLSEMLWFFYLGSKTLRYFGGTLTFLCFFMQLLIASLHPSEI